jgi:hypothetical protein
MGTRLSKPISPPFDDRDDLSSSDDDEWSSTRALYGSIGSPTKSSSVDSFKRRNSVENLDSYGSYSELTMAHLAQHDIMMKGNVEGNVER